LFGVFEGNENSASTDQKQTKRPPVRIGILVDFEEEITKGVSNTTIDDMIENVQKQLGLKQFPVEVQILSDFETFSAEVEDDPSLCDSLTIVISATSCQMTRQLYRLLIDSCPGTVVLSIHDRTCSRPSDQHGIGFPVRSSVKDVIPMVMDLRHDFLRTWDHINLVHDESVDDDMILKYVQGLTSHQVPGTPVPKILVYKVNSHGYGTPVMSHGNCTTDSGRSAITFTSAHLVDHILEDEEMKYFIVIASSGTIEHIVEEVSNSFGPERKNKSMIHDKHKEISFSFMTCMAYELT